MTNVLWIGGDVVSLFGWRLPRVEKRWRLPQRRRMACALGRRMRSRLQGRRSLLGCLGTGRPGRGWRGKGSLWPAWGLYTGPVIEVQWWTLGGDTNGRNVLPFLPSVGVKLTTLGVRPTPKDVVSLATPYVCRHWMEFVCPEFSCHVLYIIAPRPR